MKAYEPVDLSKSIDELLKSAVQDLAQKLTEAPKVHALAPLLRRLSYFYETRVYGFMPRPIVYITVDVLADIEPALRLIEDELKVTFNKTEDIAGETWVQREFKAESLPFILKVEPRLKEPNCRVEPDGFTMVPKFKVVCDESPGVAKAPVAPSSSDKTNEVDTDIPF